MEELSECFDSVLQIVLSDPEDEELQNKALDILQEIHGFVCSADEVSVCRNNFFLSGSFFFVDLCYF